MWSDKEVSEKNLFKRNDVTVNAETGQREQWQHLKEHLGDGEWQREPDRVYWEYKGFPCLIVRNGHCGQLCGYVGIPKGHPAHGLDYYTSRWTDDENTEAVLTAAEEAVNSINIHGGLTYARECSGDPEKGICHPSDGGDHVWWFGFDCAHLGDLIPQMVKLRGPGGPLDGMRRPSAALDPTQEYRETYKNIEFVTGEVQHLADQLLAMVSLQRKAIAHVKD